MRLAAIVLALLAAAPLTALAAVELVPPAAAPVEGRPVTLAFVADGAPAAGLAVTAVYRENAHASLRREQPVGATDEAGRLDWTPEQAGVVVLRWEGGTHQLSVVHDGIPVGAIVVMLLAGLALLGGSVLFFVQMLRRPEPDMIEETGRVGEPPST